MRKWLITVAFGVGVFLVGGALAAIPGADGRIHACYTKSGDTRIVDEAAACKPRENRVAWSQTGPQGPKGDKGDPGPPGMSGYEIVKKSETRLVNAQTSRISDSARCPAGKAVVGGGGTGAVAGQVFADLSASVPDDSPPAWFAEFAKPDGSPFAVGDTVNYQVYAVCVNVAS